MYKFLIRKSSFEQNTKNILLKKYLISFLLVVVFGLILDWRLEIKTQKNFTQATGDLEEVFGSVKGAYTEILNSTDKSAETLLFEGMNLVKKNQIEIGLLALEKAVEKDPYWRDAALYTGYVYLKLTEELKNGKTKKQKNIYPQNLRGDFPISKIRALEKAKEYLEKARDLDPLYLLTHQYLAIVYQKFGDTANAQLSLKKAEDFNSQ